MPFRIRECSKRLFIYLLRSIIAFLEDFAILSLRNQGRGLFLSQDELHNILGELVKSSPLGTRKLNQLEATRERARDLEQALEASQRDFQAFENSKQVLTQLLSEHNFDPEMQRLGYPAKILNGQIDLENDRQKLALDELTVTLSVKSDFPKDLTKIIQALKLFYKTYFKNGEAIQKRLTKS